MSTFEKNSLKAWKAIVNRKVPLLSPVLAAATFEEANEADLKRVPMGCKYTFSMRPDMMTITYNPDECNKQTEDMNAFGLAHEAGHYLCEHVVRRLRMKEREGSAFDMELWMIAEEMVVNRLISSLSGWPVPKDCIQPLDGWEQYTTEETYQKLKLSSNKQPKLQGQCTMCIDPQSKTLTISDGSGELLKMQITEAAAKEIEKMLQNGALKPGNMPGELRELAVRYAPLKRPPNWKDMLKRFMISTDFNCKYFDSSQIYRRMLPMCLPNLSSQPVAKKFVVSIDNSGSVDDVMFARLCGIIQSAAQQLGFQEIIVQHFTTEVMKTERMTNLKQVEKIKRRASGGTALQDCDQKAAGHRGQFHIIMTDGYVEWLDKYSLPTIIVRTVADTEAPYHGKNMIGSVVASDSETVTEK